MAVLNMKIFKINIYKHQVIAIILTIIPVILKFATIIMLFYDENNKINKGKSGNNKINYKYKESNIL